MLKSIILFALYTSQRNSDLIKIGRQHIRDGMISVVQQKTGARLWIPIHSQLKIVLDAAPADQLTLLISETGRPYCRHVFIQPRYESMDQRGWPKELSSTRAQEGVLPAPSRGRLFHARNHVDLRPHLNSRGRALYQRRRSEAHGGACHG